MVGQTEDKILGTKPQGSRVDSGQPHKEKLTRSCQKSNQNIREKRKYKWMISDDVLCKKTAVQLMYLFQWCT